MPYIYKKVLLYHIAFFGKSIKYSYFNKLIFEEAYEIFREIIRKPYFRDKIFSRKQEKTYFQH